VPHTEQPTLKSVLTYTGGWYSVPALLFLVWLAFADGAHRSDGLRHVVAGLGWVFAAILAAITLAVLMRRYVIGWRALTISFAATVIGTALVTIIHASV
jgi:hypothetical protein